jgi:formiminoglutamase
VLRERICITPHDLFDDGDACTLDIYDLGEAVARVVKTDIARAFVDMNRAPEERPPEHPDGVVKSATCLQRPIYKSCREPDDALIEMLIARYHAPYHARLVEAVSDTGIKLALDCHSMLTTAPPIEANHGEPRPLFCLSNGDGETAPPSLLKDLADAIVSAFAINPDQIGLNYPFKGGYITRTHGGGRFPWIQVEMNRCLYLEEPWFERGSLVVKRERLTALMTCFREALQLLRL